MHFREDEQSYQKAGHRVTLGQFVTAAIGYVATIEIVPNCTGDLCSQTIEVKGTLDGVTTFTNRIKFSEISDYLKDLDLRMVPMWEVEGGRCLRKVLESVAGYVKTESSGYNYKLSPVIVNSIMTMIFNLLNHLTSCHQLSPPLSKLLPPGNLWNHLIKPPSWLGRRGASRLPPGWTREDHAIHHAWIHWDGCMHCLKLQTIQFDNSGKFIKVNLESPALFGKDYRFFHHLFEIRRIVDDLKKLHPYIEFPNSDEMAKPSPYTGYMNTTRLSWTKERRTLSLTWLNSISVKNQYQQRTNTKSERHRRGW